MSIIIYPEEPCAIPVTFKANPLDIYSKGYDDIQEIMMCFKKTINDNDDAYLRLYYKDGEGKGDITGSILLDQDKHLFTLIKKETDILPVGKYNLYIGVKVQGLVKMLWLRTKKSQLVISSTDGISQ